MDNSRDADLEALHERFNDPLLSLARRRKAYRTFQSIQTQVKDRKLVDLRHELIRAHIANDVEEVEKIELQIRAHSRKSGLTPEIA